jgi:hypothetical protein
VCYPLLPAAGRPVVVGSITEGGILVKASYVFAGAAVVAAIFGLAFVLVPTQTLALYDMSVDEAGLFMTRLLGAAFLGFAIINWLVRDAGPSRERQAIALALFVSLGVGFISSLLGQLAGVANALGWLTVALYLVFSLGFGYVRFMGEDAAARPQMAR